MPMGKGASSRMPEASNLLSLYSDVQTKPVSWLWFPYIAYGKVTLLQGDPGDGKSTMMMHIIAEVSRGGAMPDGTALGRPQRVIYQCSEDSVGDTIKPRLVKMGANCKNIAYINEEAHSDLTLDDERIRDAILAFEPRLLVIDPIQAYIGNDTSMQVAGAKNLYRGLGSIDIMAAVRSVLQVERDPEDPDIRYVTHIKNSLEAIGGDFRFEIRPTTGFRWLGCEEAPELLPAGEGHPGVAGWETKREEAAHIMTNVLRERDVATTEMLEILAQYEIAEKTVRVVKQQLGVRAYRKDRQWFWSLKKPGEVTGNAP